MKVTTAPIYTFSPQSQDALFVEVQRLDCNHVLCNMDLHGHTFFELVLIDRGQGYHRVGTTDYEVERGSLFVIPPGELHDCTSLGKAEGWVLLFTHAALEGHGASALSFCWSWLPRHPFFIPFLSIGSERHRRIILPEVDCTRWSERLKDMADEISARRPGYQYGVHAYLSLILLDLFRLVEPLTHSALSENDPLLDAIFDYIESNYCRPISLIDVAAAMSRSPAYLTTLVRKRTGLTVLDWITERRMAEARRLLLQSNASLDEIAEQVGFSDPDGFARRFRQINALTPAAWRRVHRGIPPFR